MMMSRNLEAFFIFILSLFLFTIGLNHQEVIGFESRFYLFALEAWRHGPDFFPTTYHAPYPDYPGAGTFFIYLFSKLFGGLSKLTAILPSAMASAVAAAVTYLIGALHSRRWGFFAVCFLLFTAAFMMQSRTISLDNYTTAVTALGFYLVYSASLSKKSPSFALVFLLFFVGFAFRGPIGLVVPAGVLCVFYLLEKDYKRFFIIAIGGAFLLAVCSAILLGLAYHVGGSGFVHDVLHAEVLNRLEKIKTPPFYFYFKESIGAYFLSYVVAVLMFILLIPEIFKKTTRKDEQFLQKLLGWIAVILIGLSIPADKKIRYVLPMAPALALFSAYLFVIPRGKITRLTYIKNLVYGVSYFVPALCLLAIFLSYKKQFSLNYTLLILFFVAMQVSIVLYHFLSRRRDLLVFLTATISFVVAYIGIFEPINLELNRTRDFVLQVENARHEKRAGLVFYAEDPDGLPIKYVAVMPTEEPIVFIKNSSDLVKVKSRSFFIATEENFRQIPPKTLRSLRVIYRGKIGHVEVVVFQVF